jgi:hypothetical protein
MIDDDECGAIGEMRIGKGNRSTMRKPALVPLCPPQILHDLGSNLGRRGGKAANNRLGYGTAKNCLKTYSSSPQRRTGEAGKASSRSCW